MPLVDDGAGEVLAILQVAGARPAGGRFQRSAEATVPDTTLL
jgi:hypothetical protein